MIKRKRLAVLCSLKLVFSREQAKGLEKVIYVMCKGLSSSTDQDLDDIYSKFSYEKCGELLSDPDRIESVRKDISLQKVGWCSSIFDEYNTILQSELSLQAKGWEVEEGEYQCNNKDCRSWKCLHYQTQNRRSDEPPTTYVVCSVCASRYKFT